MSNQGYELGSGIDIRQREFPEVAESPGTLAGTLMPDSTFNDCLHRIG